MYETTTVDEAIAKGHRMVNYPVFAIMIATMILGFYLGDWMAPTGIGLGIALGWVYWSFRITKWKVWAFENVRNVHELKKRAIRENLIWKDGSLFNATEIWSANDREKWKSLLYKFGREDVFQDDLTVESETCIYFSKKNLMLSGVIWVCCTGVGIYLATIDKPILGIIMAVICIFMAYSDFKKANNVEPQIILNSKGIATTSTPFHEWDSITDEEVVIKGSGKNNYHCLVYKHPDGEENLDIKGLDTDLKTLNNLLILYRGRSKKRN